MVTPSNPLPPTNNFCLYPPPVLKCFWKDPLMTPHYPTSSILHCFTPRASYAFSCFNIMVKHSRAFLIYNINWKQMQRNSRKMKRADFSCVSDLKDTFFFSFLMAGRQPLQPPASFSGKRQCLCFSVAIIKYPLHRKYNRSFLFPSSFQSCNLVLAHFKLQMNLTQPFFSLCHVSGMFRFVILGIVFITTLV